VDSNADIPPPDSSRDNIREPTKAAAQRAARRKPRPKPKSRAESLNGKFVERALSAPGTLARTKALLLAALRVWELKRGIRD